MLSGGPVLAAATKWADQSLHLPLHSIIACVAAAEPIALPCDASLSGRPRRWRSKRACTRRPGMESSRCGSGQQQPSRKEPALASWQRSLTCLATWACRLPSSGAAGLDAVPH